MTDNKENIKPVLKTRYGILALIDIVNFTSQSERVGDQNAAKYTEYFQEKITAITARHNFQIIKSLGDALLVFGTEPGSLLELMKDLFQQDKPEDKYGFESRFRMVAHTGFFQFWEEPEKIVDLSGTEGIKIFRMEKQAQAWELVVTHELYRGIKALLSDKNIESHRFTLEEPLKGFDNEEWYPPFYKLRIMKDTVGTANLLQQKMAELEVDVQFIPVFGKIYPAVPMEENFINLSMVCDVDTPGLWRGQTEDTHPEDTFKSIPIKEEDNDLWIYRRYREQEFSDRCLEIDVDTLYERHKQGIIFGLPGAGKTTILRHLAFKEFNASKSKEEKDRHVVLFIPCRGFPYYDNWYKKQFNETTVNIDAGSTLNFMTWVFLFGDKPAADLSPNQWLGYREAVKEVKQAFEENRLTLLVDALDEAPDRETKEKIRALFLELASKNRLFLTSRPSEGIHLQQNRFPEFAVRSLTMDQVRKIARQLISEKSPVYKRFDQAIWQEEMVVKMAATPMTALLVTAYFQAYGKFDHRYPMYDLLVKFILLNTWENIKIKTFKHRNLSLFFKEIKEPGFLDGNPEVHALYDALALLCYGLFYDGPGGKVQRTVNEETLLRHLSDFMENSLYYRDKEKSAQHSNRWLKQFQRDHLLVRVGPEEYMFVHSTVMEYLAAYYMVEQRKNREDRFAVLVGQCLAREDYLGLEAVPIASGSDMPTGYAFVGLLQEIKTPYPRERLLEFGVRCLAELEWMIEKTLRGLQIERLKESISRNIRQNRDSLHWLYKYLKELVLTNNKENLNKALKRYERYMRLSRPTFLTEYLNYEAFDTGDSELIDLRNQLLQQLVQKSILEHWLKQNQELIIIKSVGETKAKEIILKQEENILQLDSPHYHPEDKNFNYYRECIGNELVGFWGSPNMMHSGELQTCTFAPDGKIFVSGSTNGTIKLWEVESGKEIRALIGHKIAVFNCTFSQDGAFLASASGDKTVKLWDVASGKKIRTFYGHQAEVLCCAFSPDGKFLISASRDNTLKHWDLTNGEELRTLKGHKSAVFSCAFSPKGAMLVSSSADFTLKLWVLETGKEIRTLSGHKSTVYKCNFNPAGTMLVSASRDNTLKLWDVATGEEIRTLHGHKDEVCSCVFSPDGNLLVSSSYDHTLKLWDVARGIEIHTFKGHKDVVWDCAFSSDGTFLVSASKNQTLKLWEVDSGKEIRIFNRHKDAVSASAFSSEGTLLASASTDKILKLWEVASGKEIRSFTGHTNAVLSCAFNSNGTILASASTDKTIKLWDVESGKEIRAFYKHKDWVNSCMFSPNKDLLASASGDGTLKLWDTTIGEEVFTLIGHKLPVTCCTFSPDGNLLVSTSFDKTIRLWDVASGKEMRVYNGHILTVTSSTFSPDGTLLISSSYDKSLRLWDVASGKEIRSYTGHTDWIYNCTFSNDGKFLISVSKDQTLKLWGINSFKCLKTLSLPWIPQHVAFSPTNSYQVVTANDNGTLSLFDFKEIMESSSGKKTQGRASRPPAT